MVSLLYGKSGVKTVWVVAVWVTAVWVKAILGCGSLGYVIAPRKDCFCLRLVILLSNVDFN